MIFSKSFGYAVRGVLYIAVMQDAKKFIQAEEIAQKLAVPRHFVSKILKKLVKSGVLASSKGKSGGFTVNNETNSLKLIMLFQITEGLTAFEQCALRLQQCNSGNPCPIHNQMVGVRERIQELLSNTTIGDLLKDDKEEFIKSIATWQNTETITNENTTHEHHNL